MLANQTATLNTHLANMQTPVSALKTRNVDLIYVRIKLVFPLVLEIRHSAHTTMDAIALQLNQAMSVFLIIVSIVCASLLA